MRPSCYKTRTIRINAGQQTPSNRRRKQCYTFASALPKTIGILHCPSCGLCGMSVASGPVVQVVRNKTSGKAIVAHPCAQCGICFFASLRKALAVHASLHSPPGQLGSHATLHWCSSLSQPILTPLSTVDFTTLEIHHVEIALERRIRQRTCH